MSMEFARAGDTAPAWRAALAGVLAQARARFAALAVRERILVGAALGLFAAIVLWSVAIAPAVRTVRAAPAQLASLEAQLQLAQRLATQARELRATPNVSSEQAKAALRAATERLGGTARLATSGDRATLTLNGADGAAVLTWLAEARSGARVRVLEAQLARGASGYTGNIVLGLAAP
jgi:general secretion pathway protein M